MDKHLMMLKAMLWDAIRYPGTHLAAMVQDEADYQALVSRVMDELSFMPAQVNITQSGKVLMSNGSRLYVAIHEKHEALSVDEVYYFFDNEEVEQDGE